jgi:HEAT repeats
VLKHDAFKDVRIASAIALGEIGGSESAIALERASIYDKREDVRKAAATALERLNVKARAAPPISSQVMPRGAGPAPAPPEPAASSPFRGYPAPSATAPETPAPSSDPAPPQSEPAAQPPPPPTPVTAGPQGAGGG